MSLHIVGMFLIPYLTYTVLTDNYKTDKTFKDWYEDHPMNTLNEDEDH
ncbi:hypothetical protein [Flavobacterium flevense]|nr:hypothetical protein [Flavobacterium flevense]